MFMPKQFKKAIYAQLFREGVLVLEDKPRTLYLFPGLEGIPNIIVLKTMISLKSKGFVKEQISWNHFYYFLNNDGIVFLRDYLHLPQEIAPKTLMHAGDRRAQLGPHRGAASGRRSQTQSSRFTAGTRSTMFHAKNV